MFYPQYLLSFRTTNPLRRGSGLIFVVALHIAAITAIKSGLIVNLDSPDIPPIHPIPAHETPKPPPLPTQPFEPKSHEKITFQEPSVPIPTEEHPVDRNIVGAKQTPGTNETGNYEPTRSVIIAHVDPAHPLTQPAYPAASRRGNEQGRVELMLYVLANGKIGDVQIAQSSGYSRLDESAMREALKSWRFIPQQENGVAVASWQRFAITFKLQN